MDLATVNVIALLFGVIFITSLLIAAIKIVRSRHDAQSLGNRSVKVPLNDESAVFDPTSSGLDGYTQDVATTEAASAFSEQAKVIEEPVTTAVAGDSAFGFNETKTEEISAETEETIDADSDEEAVDAEADIEPDFTAEDSEAEDFSSESEEFEESLPETSIVVAEIAGEPIYASEDSDHESDFQEIEVIENAEETQLNADESNEEPTGAIAEGLIEEFLGSHEPEQTEVEATELEEFEIEAVEADAAELEKSEVEEVEAGASELEESEVEAVEADASELEESEVEAVEADASELEDSEVEAVEADASELEESEIEAAEVDASELEESEIEAVEVDASELEEAEIDEIEDYFDPKQPAFAARASVPVSTTPLFKVAPPSVPDEAPEAIDADESVAEELPAAEAVSAEFTDEHDQVDEPVTALDESIAYDATVPIGRIDMAVEAPSPIAEAKLPAPDYSFEEVPEVEVIEDEVILGADVTNQISQLDTDLDTIEDLVREIELSLADFEPLSGFEDNDEEKAA